VKHALYLSFFSSAIGFAARIMMLYMYAVLGFLLFQISSSAETNLTSPLSSHILLASNFQPPQVFKNINLLRNINLEKGYIKETINVLIENTDSKSQDEYYLPFEAEIIEKVGGLEVRDKKDSSKPAFRSDLVEYDAFR
jgi:oligosaccharyltransferase complex subunit alpha (ribophorin I)